jgi:hypothetical protein
MMAPSMAKTRYVALLRGINVGGNNLIKMPALKACFEAQGLDDVVTYIASGNVVFTAAEPSVEKLARLIQGGISETFSCTTIAVLRSGKQMKDIVARAPKGFGTQPERFRYDVIFRGRAEERAPEPGGRRRPRGHGRPLLLAPHRPGDEEPPGQDRRHADLQEPDDPQLEHDVGPGAADGFLSAVRGGLTARGRTTRPRTT